MTHPQAIAVVVAVALAYAGMAQLAYWLDLRKQRKATGIDDLPAYPNYWADAEGGITPLDPESLRRQA